MSDFIVPDNIFPKILCRLPRKSIVQCTAVSKKWHSLIHSSEFISTHLHHSAAANRHHHNLLLRRYSKTDDPKEHYSLDLVKTLPAPPFLPPTKPYFRIVGSLNGLLLLLDDGTETIVLWNPIIRRKVLLPTPIVSDQAIGRYVYALGLGFDSSTNDHKVVKLGSIQSMYTWFEVTPKLFEVFSLKLGTWKPLDASGVDLSVAPKSCSQCFLAGSIHWLAYKKREEGLEPWLLLFDVENEVFKKMRLPQMAQNCPLYMDVFVSRGLLSVAEYYSGGASCSRVCDVWVKTQYSVRSSWTKMFTVDVDGGVGVVLDLSQNGDVLLATLKGDLVSFNPHSKETKDLGVHGSLEAFYAASYTESLVLLDKKRDDNHDEKIDQSREDNKRMARDQFNRVWKVYREHMVIYVGQTNIGMD